MWRSNKFSEKSLRSYRRVHIGFIYKLFTLGSLANFNLFGVQKTRLLNQKATTEMGNKQSKLSLDHLNELKKKTRFQEKEITQWYKGFQKDCPKGFITKAQFLELYKQYFPFGDPIKYSSLIFKYLDLNEDGEIDFDEFMISLDISCRGSTTEKIECKRQLM
jgi:hypothetical protein